jgi:hypothetical protein
MAQSRRNSSFESTARRRIRKIKNTRRDRTFARADSDELSQDLPEIRGNVSVRHMAGG